MVRVAPKLMATKKCCRGCLGLRVASLGPGQPTVLDVDGVLYTTVHRPVFQEECCRWSGWFHSLDGRAATGRCCKFPSFLWAECPSSLRRLSYTRDTASCRPGDKRHMSVDTHGALRTRQINTKQVRADKIHIDPVMRLCLCHQVTKPLLRSISIKKRSCHRRCVVSYTLKVFLTPYATLDNCRVLAIIDYWCNNIFCHYVS